MTVGIGAQVTVLDESTSAEQNFRIVAPGQGNPAEGLLSSDSPVARALAGHASGESVPVSTPRGVRHLTIVSLA